MTSKTRISLRHIGDDIIGHSGAELFKYKKKISGLTVNSSQHLW